MVNARRRFARSVVVPMACAHHQTLAHAMLGLSMNSGFTHKIILPIDGLERSAIFRSARLFARTVTARPRTHAPAMLGL